MMTASNSKLARAGLLILHFVARASFKVSHGAHGRVGRATVMLADMETIPSEIGQSRSGILAIPHPLRSANRWAGNRGKDLGAGRAGHGSMCVSRGVSRQNRRGQPVVDFLCNS